MNYEVGDILESAYGTEMVVRCYQVVRKTGDVLSMREIKCKEVSPRQYGKGIIIRGTVKPMKGKFVNDDVIVRRVNCWGYVVLNAWQHIHAHKWEGSILPYDICPAIVHKKRRC